MRLHIIYIIAREELFFAFLCLGKKRLVVGAVGMEGLVVECFLDGLPVFEELLGERTEVDIGKSLPNELHRLLRWVKHVGLVETIVAQLV